MNAGLIILRVASERRGAQNERDRARAAQLRRSSDSVGRRSSVEAALQPITQLVVSAAPRGGTRRHVEEERELRAASPPSQPHQLRRSSQLNASAGDGSRQCPATMSDRRGLMFQQDEDDHANVSSSLLYGAILNMKELLGVTHPMRFLSFFLSFK